MRWSAPSASYGVDNAGTAGGPNFDVVTIRSAPPAPDYRKRLNMTMSGFILDLTLARKGWWRLPPCCEITGSRDRIPPEAQLTPFRETSQAMGAAVKY